MVTRKVVLASARVCPQKAPEAQGRTGTVVILCTQKRVASVSFEFLSGYEQKEPSGCELSVNTACPGTVGDCYCPLTSGPRPSGPVSHFTNEETEARDIRD